MFLKKTIFLFLSFIVYINMLLPSITSGTFIKAIDDFIAVENIANNDTIIAYDTGNLFDTKVINLSAATTDTLIAITTKKGTFYACPDQLFFDPILKQWVAAKNITSQTTFLNAQLQHCPCLHVEKIHAPETKIYRITTNHPHNFFVTEQELLTHNTPVFVIGLAWLFGEGLKFAGLTVGASALGSYVGVQLYNREKEKQKDKDLGVSFEVGFGGYNPDPDDNERKFNTITKSEFFKSIKNDYEHYRNGIYKRKKGAKGIERTEYLEWDHLHGDVEAYAKGGKHLGSIDPRTFRIYKGPVVRTLPL